MGKGLSPRGSQELSRAPFERGGIPATPLFDAGTAGSNMAWHETFATRVAKPPTASPKTRQTATRFVSVCPVLGSRPSLASGTVTCGQVRPSLFNAGAATPADAGSSIARGEAPQSSSLALTVRLVPGQQKNSRGMAPLPPFAHVLRLCPQSFSLSMKYPRFARSISPPARFLAFRLSMPSRGIQSRASNGFPKVSSRRVWRSVQSGTFGNPSIGASL